MNDAPPQELYGRACALRQKGDLGAALSGYQELLSSLPLADPLRAQVFFDLGELALAMDAFERAERLFSSAIFADPFHAQARRRLSEIYLPTLPPEALISVVLPTYNRCRDLLQCIESLRRNSYFRLDIRVICEPCEDGSLEYLATQKDSLDVSVTINPTRLGMADSINLGLSQSRGDYIFLINDDLEFTPGWDVCVVKTLAAFPEAGCGVPLVLYPNGAIQSPGNYNPFRSHSHDWIGSVPHVNTAPAFGKPICYFPQLQVPRPCDYGYFPFFKRACWEKVGYVDKGFKRYFIDPDFGYRIQQAGYQNIYCPHSVLIHHELSHKDMQAVYEVARGDRQHFFDNWDLTMSSPAA